MTEAPAYCINCGTRLPAGAAYCPGCGQRVAPAEPATGDAALVEPAAVDPGQPVLVEPPATTLPLEYQTPLTFIAPPTPDLQEEAASGPGQAGPFWYGVAIGALVLAIAAVGAMLLGYLSPGPKLTGGAAAPAAPLQRLQPGTDAPASGAPSKGAASAAAIPGLDQTDIAQVAVYLADLVRRNEPQLIANLVGTSGAAFAPYASEAQLPGENNGDHIATELRQALAASQPDCIGYIPHYGDQPPKALVLFGGMGFDWPRLGLEDPLSGVTGFGFFQEGGRWELTFIGPVPAELMPSSDVIEPLPGAEYAPRS